MGAAQKLDSAKFAALQHLTHIKELVGIQRCFHHHIMLAGLALCLYNSADIVKRGRHGNSTGAVLARLQHSHALLCMQRDRRDQMHRVDRRVGKNRIKAADTACAAEVITCLPEPVGVGVANRQFSHVRVLFVDLCKRAAETEPDERNIDFFHKLTSFRKRDIPKRIIAQSVIVFYVFYHSTNKKECSQPKL